MKTYIIVITLAAVLLTACTTKVPTTPITSFDECVEAGFAVMESHPQQCSDGETTFIEELDSPVACTREYMPVCGSIQVQCVTTPCDPVRETFSNDCVAKAAGAFDITEGECAVQGGDLKAACESNDGTWVAEHNECEFISEELCTTLGGSFDECASACRHIDDSQVACMMMCVPLCSFN